MKTGRAILLSVALVLVPILFILGYILVYIPYQYSPEKFQEKGEEGFQEGRAAGSALTESRCLSAAVNDYKRGRLDVRKTKGWLVGCLQTSQMDDTFCNGVPEVGSQPPSGWERRACAARGFDNYCTLYMEILQHHCTQK
jgi:hypothetical protein